MAALSAGPAAARVEKAFVDAVYQTKVGPRELQAIRASSLLRERGLRDESDALALELTYRYPERLNGVPPQADLTLGMLINAGRLRPPPSQEWLVRLQQGVAKSVAVEWPKGETITTPGALDPYLRVREPLAPGVWRVPFDVPRIYIVFDLLNRAAQPLPMFDFTMALPGEAGAPRYECKFERAAGARGNRATPTLLPGARGTAVCFRAVTQPAEAAMLAALAAARDAGQVVDLKLVVEPSAAARDVYNAMISNAEPFGPAWGAALQQARDPSLRWRASELPLGAPVPVLTFAQRMKGAGQALTSLMAFTMASLTLFMLGRVMQRMGVPITLVTIATFVLSVLAAGVLAVQVAGDNPTAGEGWQRGAVTGAIAAFGVFFVLFGALMLHALHRRLDADGVSWLDTVISGWRNAFRLGGTASSGEFWGFYAHALWLLVAVRMALRPWDLPVSALIVVAMLTMARRRFAAFRPAEQIAIVLVVLLYILVVAMDW